MRVHGALLKGGDRSPVDHLIQLAQLATTEQENNNNNVQHEELKEKCGVQC